MAIFTVNVKRILKSTGVKRYNPRVQNEENSRLPPENMERESAILYDIAILEKLVFFSGLVPTNDFEHIFYYLL